MGTDGLRIHLPDPIENILRARFGNALVHGADYTLSGHSDLEFEFVVVFKFEFLL